MPQLPDTLTAGVLPGFRVVIVLRGLTRVEGAALSRRALGRDHAPHLLLVPAACARAQKHRRDRYAQSALGTVHSAAPRAAGSEVSYPRSSGSQGVGSVVNRSGCRSRGD